MTNTKEIYKLIAMRLASNLPKVGDIDMGQDHMRMFVRIEGQVFAITVEERPQFQKAYNPVSAARDFMANLPVRYLEPTKTVAHHLLSLVHQPAAHPGDLRLRAGAGRPLELVTHRSRGVDRRAYPGRHHL